jgi:hypothetical protein
MSFEILSLPVINVEMPSIPYHPETGSREQLGLPHFHGIILQFLVLKTTSTNQYLSFLLATFVLTGSLLLTKYSIVIGPVCTEVGDLLLLFVCDTLSRHLLLE